MGRRFKHADGSLCQIVGVVEDGKYDSLTETPQAAMFFPLAQARDSDTTLVVRSHLPVSGTATAVDRVLTHIDAGLPFVVESWILWYGAAWWRRWRCWGLWRPGFRQGVRWRLILPC